MNRAEGMHVQSGAALARLVSLAQAMGDGDSMPRQRAGLMRFEQAVARRTLRTRNRFGWVLALSAATAAAVVGIVRLRGENPALTMSVVNGAVSDRGYVNASSGGGTELRFSDGSNLALDPGTSTRVTELDARGGRVLLESGHAHVKVTPRPRAKWTVDAGPYSVHVVGTEFDVRWSAADGVFDVDLHKGAVIIKGPLASAGLAMEAGQHLVANVKRGEISLDGTPAGSAEEGAAPADPMHAEEAPEAAPAPAGSINEPQHVPTFIVRASRGKSTIPTPAAVSPALSWGKRIAQGDFHGVVADAERRGLEDTLESAPPADLTALADAARYVRRNDVARRALLAERERFGSSLAAREAAFFLGGLSEDEPGASGATSALDWYDRYLGESPHGAYVSQALGRKMLLLHKLHGRDAARSIAEDYLERFPRGAYAAPARRLLEAR